VKPTRRILRVAWALISLPAAATAQQAPASDTLRLAVLLQDALRADPRARQLELHAQQTDLRLRNLAVERLPTFSGEGQAQYQSDVAQIPVRLPSGATPTPPKDTYEARLGVEQRIIDPTIAPRRAVLRAELAESQASVESALYGLRREVNDAFFAAALLQERAHEISSVITGLEARVREVAAHVREGTALPGEGAALEATLLQRRQDEAEVVANRAAALTVLSELTGRAVRADAMLALPDLSDAVASARVQLEQLRARPEYQRFARAQERLALQGDVVSARELPSVSAYGRLGYGRPALSLLGDRFDAYWLAGIQVRWTPWTWRSTSRERAALRVQQEIVAADEAAFTESVQRAVQTDLSTIDRLSSTLTTDDQIVALRERIENETRLRLQEGAVTAAEYVDRQTDVLEARIARARHRVERAQAQATFLTTIGLEVH
jgi:outer membrane protein TolC